MGEGQLKIGFHPHEVDPWCKKQQEWWDIHGWTPLPGMLVLLGIEAMPNHGLEANVLEIDKPGDRVKVQVRHYEDCPWIKGEVLDLPYYGIDPILYKFERLHLVLKTKWYRMIESGEKLEEYRELTDYWAKRIEGKDFDCVVFYLGYQKDRESMAFLPRGIEPGTGKKEWGAIPDKEYYVIKLGDRIS